MNIIKSDRPSAPRPKGRASSVRVGSLVGILLAFGIGCAWIATREPVEDLRYGQFKKKLTEPPTGWKPVGSTVGYKPDK